MRATALSLLIALSLVSGCSDSASDTTSSPRGAAGPGPTSTTRPGVADAAALLDTLRDGGSTVDPSEPARGDGALLGVTPTLFCLDGFPLQVFEYASPAEREQHSEGISADGSELSSAGGGAAIVEWVGPPRFYASGPMLVLYLGPEGVATTHLEDALGPTITPDAGVGGGPAALPCV